MSCSGTAPSSLRSAARLPWMRSSRMPDFRGKIALITGVGRVGQIGHAVARGFGRAGAQLVIADVNAGGLADREKEFTGEGFTVHAAAGDLTTPDAAHRAVAVARQRFGGLDVVVNVAGGLVSYGPVLDLKPGRLEVQAPDQAQADDLRWPAGV